MTISRNQKILSLIEKLSSSAKLAEELALEDTARLLAMALLDLQTALYAISPRELRSFTRTIANVVEFKAKAPANDAKRAEIGENSQSGQVPFVG